MEHIVVKVDKLEKALKKNMKTHEADFEIAWEAYATAVVINLQEMLKAAKDLKPGVNINLNVNLTRPENHSKDYERALQMLDWHQEDEIALSESEFTQFVQDDWGWKSHFSSVNQFYTGSVSPSNPSR